MQWLSRNDSEVAQLIKNEETRINNTLDLIAAESITPPSVMEALGSIFNTKAAEGYPGRRFHAGCRYADALEELAISRGKQLFNAEHVNVQSHCGSSANLAVYFSKLDQAKYLGHLELVNVFLRALKRAEIPVVFSQGFHPKPKVSFDDPLPIGIESEQERFTLSVPDYVRPQSVVRRLNDHLPEGLAVKSCQITTRKSGQQAATAHTYVVSLREGEFEEEKLASFNRATNATISLSNRKGKLKKIDLKDMVLNIALPKPTRLKITLMSAPGKTMRPAMILRHIFGVAEDQIKQAKVVKQRAEVTRQGV